MESAHVGHASASRNAGRSRACGPCHRRKVACDRSRPTCGSCRRRRRKEPCEYEVEPSQHSSSLTPTPTSSGPAQNSPRPPESFTPRRATPATLQNEPSTCFNSGSVDTRDSLTSGAPAGAKLQSSRTGSPPRPGYLGPTSFVGIYEEACDTVALPSPQLLSRTQRRNEFRETTERQKTSLSDTLLRTRRNVLENIPRRHQAKVLFDNHFGPHDAWIRPLARRMLDSFFDSFEGFLGPNESNEQSLDLLGDLISNNTAKYFSEDEHDTEQWVDQFTGANFRWESLGVLFVYWELGSRKERPPGLKMDPGVRENAAYRSCVSECLSLARAATTTGNTLVVYLHYKRMIIDSVFSGDASKSARNVLDTAPEIISEVNKVSTHILTGPRHSPLLLVSPRRDDSGHDLPRLSRRRLRAHREVYSKSRVRVSKAAVLFHFQYRQSDCLFHRPTASSEQEIRFDTAAA